MWVLNVYSEGDLLHDEYLLSNYEIVQTDNFHEFNKKDLEPKFRSEDDVDNRISTLKRAISRLEAEKELLEKYKYCLLDVTTWSEVVN